MAKLELAVAHPTALCPLFPDQIAIWGVGFCGGRKTGETSCEPSKNTQQTNAPRTRTWATLVGREYSHHGTILMLMLYVTRMTY